MRMQVSNDIESISVVLVAVIRLRTMIEATECNDVKTMKAALLASIAKRFHSHFTQK